VRAGCWYDWLVPLAAERSDARSWPEPELAALLEGAFPPFITADQEVKRYIGRVREWFAGFDLVLVEDGQTLVAAGWAVPVTWTGQTADLPAGYTDALRRAVTCREHGGTPDTLVICGAVVAPGRTRQGLAAAILTALRDLAGPAGCARVIAPVRPTLKPAYPLTPIATFATWTRPDGSPLDPWLRTHWRLGAKIIATAPRSQVMTGTVAEWETWTGLALPVTGEYVIPGGLATLHIDRERDEGTYTEPGVWVRHQ
jgi:GNAT superfamily N-acetyltransferase